MSTEKSLLTYEHVRLPVLTREQKKEGLVVPIGVTPGEHLETLLLKHELGTDHMCLFGKVGSGKSKALEFIIKSVCWIYGKDVTLSYIDGKDCDVKYWQKINLVSAYKLCGCQTVNDLASAIDMMLERVECKKSLEPDIMIFDDVTHLVHDLPSAYILKLRGLLVCSTHKNTHILYASQVTPTINLIHGCPNENYFGVMCATRLDDTESGKIFGGSIASTNGGVRRYGELVYKYIDNVSKVRVPFCDSHK